MAAFAEPPPGAAPPPTRPGSRLETCWLLLLLLGDLLALPFHLLLFLARARRHRAHFRRMLEEHER